MESSILTLLIFFPLVGAFMLLLVPKDRTDLVKLVSLTTAIVTMLLSFWLYGMFETGVSGMQFVVDIPWVQSIGINYSLGIDGISLLLIVLTTILTALAILASWNSITQNVRGYYFSMLLLATGMIGVFCALDFFLFYVFWEVMLVPMYFIIGLWGGARRLYAAIKFVLFTMFGSLLMLVAILYMYFHHAGATGEYTFSILRMGDSAIPLQAQLWLFGAFALAFAIKVPLFPFHTWLPDAHVEAPTAGSVILAGVLLKMGTYGFLRICLPIFPEATMIYLPYICWLSVIAIIYGALVAMVQKDVKSLVAFSSVSHMGFVMLGMFALNEQGMSGAVMQMINHGVSTGALFLLVGMLYDRRHTRLIEEFGGIAHVQPVYATAFMIVALSSIGLPLTNGFVGEFLILLGAYKANPVWGVLAASGVIFAAGYMLWMYQRVMYGPVTKEENKKLTDINWRERIILLPLIILIFWFGIYPKPFFAKIEPAVKTVLSQVARAASVKADPLPAQNELAAPLKAGDLETVSVKENGRE